MAILRSHMSTGGCIRLSDLEPIPCPMDLGLPADTRLEALTEAGWHAMERRLDDLEREPARGDDLRLALLGWFVDLGRVVREKGCASLIASRLGSADLKRRAAMLAWFEGRWSSRPALLELCWRLEVDPTVTTAALLLFDRGGGTEEQQPYIG